MRKLTVLTSLFIFCLFLFGCGEDRYAIEKQFYKVIKRAEKIFKNPHASPPQEVEGAVKAFSNFSQKHPKTYFAIDAEFSIARLYIVKEEYEKARTQLKKIKNSYSKSEAIRAEALFLTGNSYEIENKWDSALTQYKKIIQEYPLTIKGMEIPIYIAQHYKVKFQPDKMVEAYREAISHYSSLSEKYPKTPLAYRTMLLVSHCYAALEEWQKTIESLEDIIVNYKDKIPMDGILVNIATVYSLKLKDEAKAKEALERLIRDYPKSRLAGGAKKTLKNMEAKKNEQPTK